jgi:hypothetical protein
MKPHVPQTYDEITRKTVLEPDGSIRPAPEGAPSERSDLELRGVVADVLLASGLSEIGVEVAQGRITLRGWVRDANQVAHVLRVVAAVAPDVEISDRMHVGRPT